MQKAEQHILFLTGKLAEKRLSKVLAGMQPTDFSFEIRNIGVSVAALMTAQMLVRRLDKLQGVDSIIVPGLCRGDLQQVSEHTGIPVIRGPVDLKDLPVFFGRDCKPVELDKHAVRIFAEITDAPLIAIDDILAQAERFRMDGADVIDVGCLPDTPFPHLEETVTALHEAGFKVSVDSLENDDLLRGGKAGADYLLSVSESSVWIAEEVAAIPVLIPEQHKDLVSLYRIIEAFEKNNRPFIADSILDPVHFGFTDSITRYHELRTRFPDIDIMMGIGNLTELTEADTTGINALLFGIISELDIGNVLATEVSPHACSAIREADLARRIMYAAREQESLPKGLDSGLLIGHSRKPHSYCADEVMELAAEIRDPSYRIMVSEKGIHVYNRDGIETGQNAFDLFPRLKPLQDDAPHAFYMGYELAKAVIAMQLGKRYNQDEELDWGVAVREASDDELANRLKAAHDMREQNNEYKATGSTLKASRANRKKPIEHHDP